MQIRGWVKEWAELKRKGKGLRAEDFLPVCHRLRKGFEILA